jgi:hypothetical protein
MSQKGVNNIAGGGGGGSPVMTLTGNNSLVHVPPTANDIKIVGSGGVLVTGNAGTSTLTITVGGGGFTWSDQALSFTAVAENGYFTTAPLTITLPAVAAEGDTIEIIVTDATPMGCVVQASGAQKIAINTQLSGAGGTATNATAGDALELIYRTVGTTWWCLSREGNWRTSP